MCETCGCGDAEWTIGPQTTHYHMHADGTAHSHDHARQPHEHRSTAVIDLGARVFAGNDNIALLNRAWFSARGIVALNLMSGPGAGKTTLLERTLREFRSAAPIVVIEGDQATDNDATRIRAAGGRSVQINTGKGCHLDAAMIQRGLAEVNPPNGVLLVIENVGNLVCPSLFDLGESARIALLSVTEGDDKPLKYPHMFAAADLLLLNKMDLCPYVDFDVDKAVDAALRVNPRICVLRISAKTGEGMQSWFDWLSHKQNGRSVDRPY